MGHKLKITGWVALGVMAGALTTVSLQTVARGTVAPLPLEELQQLAQVFGMIKSTYVEPVDEKKLIRDAISGMVSGLDPHSQYFDQKAFKEFSDNTAGKFIGVGIEITSEEGLVKVVTPIEGSPAFRAGLKTNDLIIKIDDTAVKGLTLNQAVKRMRGEPNTVVVLTIYRKEESRTFQVSITRAEILQDSVRFKVVEPGYAWIRVSQFQERSADDLVKKLDAIYQQDPQIKGLVLDLRNNPGGLLGVAASISSIFLPENLTVVSSKGQIRSSQYEITTTNQPGAWRSTGGNIYGSLSSASGNILKTLSPKLKKVPLVVLVNEGSASASEIVAGALQDHKRAKIMGGQTFGKGSVQTVECMGHRSSSGDCPTAGLKITTARYYTPSGNTIQAKGVVPDLMLDDTEEGSPYAALRTREADLEKHISNGQGEEKIDPAAEKAREKAREDALKRLEEESRKPLAERRPPEAGSDKDFQLAQAINQLKGRPVLVSKTLVERKEEKKDN